MSTTPANDAAADPARKVTLADIPTRRTDIARLDEPALKYLRDLTVAELEAREGYQLVAKFYVDRAFGASESHMTFDTLEAALEAFATEAKLKYAAQREWREQHPNLLYVDQINLLSWAFVKVPPETSPAPTGATPEVPHADG